MLDWAKQFNIFCLLDSHQYNKENGGYDCLLAAGSHQFTSSATGKFSDINDFLKEKEWVFGHLSYELKNEFFPASKQSDSKITFPEFFFFEPQIVLAIRNDQLFIYADDPEEIFRQISEHNSVKKSSSNNIQLEQKLTRPEYTDIIKQLKEHIQLGDCYEINFCQEFCSENVIADPFSLYRDLTVLSPAPYSAFYKVDENYLVCASPERFISKTGTELTAQPMKGTAKRNNETSIDSDRVEVESLRMDQKERSENVMIVDLMRNDLSKVCKKGSVHVSELYGVYSFPNVHQMVSTIKGTLSEGIGFYEIIEATFPMGSMTGAPKQRVIELIDQYETTPRGIFSGALGYFHKGDFDFNVVIRSVMYNSLEKYLSVKVGSGITIYSDPEKEWVECMIKAEAIKKVLAN
jgi:para-aminobenzoate synthetase component I